MTELLTLLGAALVLTVGMFPSLLSVGTELVPRRVKSTLVVLAGAVLVFGVNATAG